MRTSSFILLLAAFTQLHCDKGVVRDNPNAISTAKPSPQKKRLVIRKKTTKPNPPKKALAPSLSSVHPSRPNPKRATLAPKSVLKAKKREGLVIFGAGDILMSPHPTKNPKKYDMNKAFAHVTPILKTGDIAFGNLEAPTTLRGKRHPTKKYRFRQHPIVIDVLKKAGFTLLSLSNNHILDYGMVGAIDTIKAAQKYKIHYAGVGRNFREARKPAIFKVNGHKVGFLAFTLTYPRDFWANKKRGGTVAGFPGVLKKDIRKLKKKVDLVIVSFHWGGEGRPYPKQYQKDTGKLAIQYGAKIVFGHHPHVLEGVELYRGGVIYYSLGNFFFATMLHNKASILAKVTLDKNLNIKEVAGIPFNVSPKLTQYQPRPAAPKLAKRIYYQMRHISKGFGTRTTWKEKRMIFKAPRYKKIRRRKKRR